MKLQKLLIFIAFLGHTVSCQKEGSLAFVIDNTNSMRTDIQYVRGGVDKIMDVILKKKSSQIEDIILVRFNDPDYEELITTRDRNDLKKVLGKLRTRSDYFYNKECPEMALHGVRLGLESSRDNSHMFVFADSSPKDFELTKEVIRLAQNKSSQIVFILTEGNNCGEISEMFDPYYEIAKATFGQVLRIKAKTEIGKVIDYIAETCSGERTVLVQIDIPEREHRRVSILSSIAFYATGSYQKMVGLNLHLGMSQTAVSACLSEVTEALNTRDIILGQISFPANAEERQDVIRRFYEVHNFPGVVGCIDGTHVAIIRPKDSEEAFYNRKHYHSINCLLFDVDDQTEYVIISASGKHVTLDWSEMVHSFNVKINRITWLDHFKALKIIVPRPGRYSVTVWGRSETSVYVYGRTNFKFHYGFSLSPVQSLMDTVKNPTAGEKYHLAISVNDPGQAILIDAVELLDMKENVLKNLSLNRESPDFYTTKQFLPPISTFLIAVIGEGKYTHEPVRRISKTPIEPKMKDSEPIIKIDRIKDTYEYNSKLDLKCNVKGYPKPYITWTDENSTMLTKTTLQKNPPYQYSYHLTVDKLKISQNYTCYAENKFGKRSKNVIVNVDSPFVVTKHLEDVTNVSFEKHFEKYFELICDIKSKFPMKITWWTNSELVTSHVSNDGTKLTINKAYIQDQDTYICKAELLEDGLTQAYQTKLKIEGLKPIVSVGQIKNTYEYNSTLYLNCNVKGYPRPQIIWKDENGITLRNMIFKRNTVYDYSYHKTIEKLKKSRNYTCYAENKFGKDSRNVIVNVDSPFVVTNHLEDVTNVSYEKEIELICDIKSKWRMKITWWKNGRLVTSHVSNDGTKLMIKKASIDDQGIYICEAKLLEDDLTLTYQTELKISGLILPHIEKQTAFLIIKKAEPVTLTCKITKGFPVPKRVWKFKETGSDKWIAITNSEERMTIERSQLRSGNYKCLASNVIGYDEMDIELAVEVPPEIIPSERTVSAVELDLVLRIPCETIGYPKPNVAWRVNGSIIEMGERYTLDKNTLVVLNPVTNDSGNYTCKVDNQFGSDSKTTEAIVKNNDKLIISKPNIDDTTTSNPIQDQGIEKKDQNTKYILEGSIISLDCPHAKDDAVRWYKDYQYLNITGSPLVIKKGATRDDGIYNCRASNYYGTQSYSFKINVGYEPRGNTEPVIINKDGSLDQTLSKSLDCKFDVKPMTNEIVWTFNGVRINENTTDFNGEINWGIYTCSITNPHGTAKRTFTVISNDCLIKKSQISKNAPLILTEDSTWPDIYYNENYLRLPRNINSKLFCRNQKKSHNHFESFSKNNEILATCVGENKFSVNDTIVKFEDLQCNLPIRHIINETGATCLNENTELFKVGFEVDEFVEIYNVCVDKTKMVPLYTRIDMTPLYNVKRTQFATARMNEINGDKCGEGSKCCFGKTQLVSEREVRYGPSQAATLIEMNYVPYWRPCDEKLGWNNIEEKITKKLEQIEGQFVIWSGASNYTKKSDVTIPRYLWKVITIVDSKYSFSVVYVNDPTPAIEDKLCEDICSQFDWITSSESIYCCRIEEFRKAFNIPENLQ